MSNRHHVVDNQTQFGEFVMSFDYYGNHKLSHISGKQTKWAPYTQPTYLLGMVGHTAYYGTKENVVPVEQFCKENFVGE